jgi:hypothetical protein
MSFYHYHCLVDFNEETVSSSVHRAFVIENTLSTDALVPGMSKENSKIICMFLNEMALLCTNSNTSDHHSTVVIKLIFQSLILFVIWLNSLKMSSSSKIFIIFWSTLGMYLVLCRISSQTRGFCSSIQRNAFNGRKVLLHFSKYNRNVLEKELATYENLSLL